MQLLDSKAVGQKRWLLEVYDKWSSVLSGTFLREEFAGFFRATFTTM